jgi:hypothetical protein
MRFELFAPLSNARGHFRSLELGGPFRVERWPRSRMEKLWRKLSGLPSFEIAVQAEHLYVASRDVKTCHVVVASVEAPGEGPEIEAYRFLDDLTQQLRERSTLVSLFLSAHVEPAAAFWHAIQDEKPTLFCGESVLHSIADAPGTLSVSEASKLNTFLKDTALPLKREYIQLALDHWEESLRANSKKTELLSLVTAIEALFNVGHTDIKYRVSRSMAVLLGDDTEESERVYDVVREAYDVRSQLVHTGKSKGIDKVWCWMLRRHVRDAIVRHIELDQKKEVLAERFTRLGFGQASEVTANPSIERTLPGKPVSASHVKR